MYADDRFFDVGMFVATLTLGWLAKLAQSGAAILAFFTGAFDLVMIGASLDECAGG